MPAVGCTCMQCSHTEPLNILTRIDMCVQYVKITGRIKEQYKLENGKYVVPAPLEDILCRSEMISQCLVYGDNQMFNVVLVVPEFAEVCFLSTTANGEACGC